MDSKDALNFLKWYIAEEDIRKEIDDRTVKERIGIIQKDLEMLKELKKPYDEYETDDYFLTRQAYYNENLGELCFAYTVYKWDGTYKEREIPTTKKKMKFKNWVEESHAGCGTAKTDLKEYLEHHLRLKKILESKVQ